MALRRIAQIGEEVLRKKSRKVEKIDDRILQLLDDMAETMYEAEGVGLAAPQVGILKRVIVIDIGDGLIELINPEIVETSGEQIDSEGCLSVEGESAEVRRPMYVKVRGLNREGVKVEYEAEEFLARAFCHETDHLEGVLFVDKTEK
ncbi:peptide deformylase [Metaclostridioides mangenotii]|uniref:peptide deformylase n=1 Tax=Metaclostridioides mangenotii TaxID=1540 RepID=UPI0026F18E35|nr:peptide deformylase [Clostridioides mangenotii]